ncbi:MAG: NAD(P)H-hydrate dehydratase [Acidobacteria bacterium]|nr:NAD(P)H-hydrate dehydratase [Acidobacteriota bacterium]
MSVKVLTASQMREADRATIEELGVPGLVLMENAGRNVAAVLEQMFPSLAGERITILCGKGNNGGDGLVVARHLKMRGHSPRVVLLAEPGTLNGDARSNYEILLKSGITPAVARNAEEWARLRPELYGATLLVDAILGTGLTGPVEGFLLEVISDLNSSFAHLPLVSVDIPSGLGSDSGAVPGESLRARCTVTFTAPKWSQVLPPSCERVGELIVTPIGTPPSVYAGNPEVYLNLLGVEDLAPFVRPRQAESHKGDYGHVLVVGGSRGKSGAAALAALGALNAGAGLVTAATAASILPLVAGFAPTLMTEPLAETDAGSISQAAFDYGRFAAVAADKSVLAIGPGISTVPSTIEFVRRIVKDFPKLPIVVDADGLNAFAGAVDLLQGKGRQLILTPHPGEMARLAGLSTQQVQSDRVDIARNFAMKHQVCLLLKGNRTLIGEPGGQVYVNPTGNPGMATAGTGDVLTGMIAGLLAQHPDAPVDKVVSAAVYWHGAAGDAAAAQRGELSLTATDLLQALPLALPGARHKHRHGHRHEQGHGQGGHCC